MSVRLREVLMREFGELRHEPSDKRIRGMLGEQTVVDSVRALLVWEPRRIVPTYAFPADDIAAELVAAPAAQAGIPETGLPRMTGRAVLDPSVPFAVRETAGEPLLLRAAGREAAAFRPADADLDGYVIVDFDAFDAWYEEDERNLAHPRDPFHRIDIVHSHRHVRVERDGDLLAESSQPYLLFEPPLPPRYYLPAQDVSGDALTPSALRTLCAYKGEAHYLALADGEDVAWTYPAPLREAAEVAGRVAFFNERVDIVVDGTLLARPETPWSRRG
jgi:uncharacterized protein (DUF427 family)